MQLRYGLPAELVVARGIPFRTVCEHHLLPFPGLAHGGYLPGERIIGLSKLARPAEHLAAGPQAHERLTTPQSSYDLQAKPGPRTRDFTSARHGGKRHADQVNINSWRSS
jgi:GTP cyclohydrolase I